MTRTNVDDFEYWTIMSEEDAHTNIGAARETDRQGVDAADLRQAHANLVRVEMRTPRGRN